MAVGKKAGLGATVVVLAAALGLAILIVILVLLYRFTSKRSPTTQFGPAPVHLVLDRSA